MSYKKGSRAEREVVNLFWKAGWGGIRSPGSGRATRKPQPDLLVGRPNLLLALQVKSTKEDTVYIREQEADELFEFSKRMGAIPYIVAKFLRRGTYIMHVEKLSTTSSGNLRFKLGEGEEINSFIKRMTLL